jgi:hypothetical protein
LLVVVALDIMVVAVVLVDFFGMDHQLQQKQQMVSPLLITTAQHIQYLLVAVAVLLVHIQQIQKEVIVELPQS